MPNSGRETEAKYESIVDALSGAWDKPYGDLSDELKALVHRAFPSGTWDGVSAEGRQTAAKTHDYFRAPEHRPELTGLWQLESKKRELGRRRIALARMVPNSPLDWQAQAHGLKELDSEELDIVQQLELIDANARNLGTPPDQSGQVLPGHLFTDDVCEAFRDVGMSSLKWRATLTKNRPAWLMQCRVCPGKPGAVQAAWCPLKIAEALATGRSRIARIVSLTVLDRAFTQRPLLKPIAQQWRDLRQDHPAWGD